MFVSLIHKNVLKLYNKGHKRVKNVGFRMIVTFYWGRELYVRNRTYNCGYILTIWLEADCFNIPTFWFELWILVS